MNTFLSGPMRKIANMGRMGDTELAHVTPEEKKLLKAMGGSGTMNPRTGMPEYFLNELASGIRRAFGQPDPEERNTEWYGQCTSNVADAATEAGQVDPLDIWRMKSLLFKRYEVMSWIGLFRVTQAPGTQVSTLTNSKHLLV